jgi:hypothetical protein
MEMVELRFKQKGPEGGPQKGKGKQRATDGGANDAEGNAAPGKKGESSIHCLQRFEPHLDMPYVDRQAEVRALTSSDRSYRRSLSLPCRILDHCLIYSWQMTRYKRTRIIRILERCYAGRKVMGDPVVMWLYWGFERLYCVWFSVWGGSFRMVSRPLF